MFTPKVTLCPKLSSSSSLSCSLTTFTSLRFVLICAWAEGIDDAFPVCGHEKSIHEGIGHGVECWEPNTWNERVLEMVKSHKISWIQESFNIFPVVWIRHSWRMANACSCYQIQTYQKSLYDRTLEGNTGTFLQIAWFCVLFFRSEAEEITSATQRHQCKW